MDCGLISISINFNYQEHNRHQEMERRLINRLKLKNCRVLNNRNRDPQYIQQDVGSLAAEYIMTQLKKNMVIGTGWGTTLRDTVEALSTTDLPIEIVQLMGNVSSKLPNCTAHDIAANVASHFQCHADYLDAPLFIEDDHIHMSLCKDSKNKIILNKGGFSDMLLVGIDDVECISKKDYWLAYMTDDMYQELIQKGAVGAIFARFYDKRGKEVDCTWNRKCLSISLKDILEVPNIVAIAASVQKAAAILAAARGSLIDTLITDGTTATAILDLL